MSTACKIATYAMNAGLDEDQFVAVVSASDFSYLFATENGRDRTDRLDSRLRKVWDRVADIWEPPIGSVADVRQKLEQLSQRLAAHAWTGRSGNSDRAVSTALVEKAHKLGVWTLDVSERDLSVRAGVARSTVQNSFQRLQKLGVIRRDSETTRAGTHSQRWVLNLGWGITAVVGPHDSVNGGQGLCGLVTALNHPAFLRSALGQSAERVYRDLAEHPGSTAAETGQRTALPVRTVRKNLAKLESHDLVMQTGTRAEGRGKPAATYRLDPQGRLDAVAHEYGTTDWHDRTAERYNRERDGFAEVQRQKANRNNHSQKATTENGHDHHDAA